MTSYKALCKETSYSHERNSFQTRRVVGCGEGVMYLTSLGRPTDIGLQLGKACFPCSK